LGNLTNRPRGRLSLFRFATSLVAPQTNKIDDASQYEIECALEVLVGGRCRYLVFMGGRLDGV
jgi:hypothetical protein